MDGGISNEAIEDMVNASLHVMRFLGLNLEDDVPDYSYKPKKTAQIIFTKFNHTGNVHLLNKE